MPPAPPPPRTPSPTPVPPAHHAASSCTSRAPTSPTSPEQRGPAASPRAMAASRICACSQRIWRLHPDTVPPPLDRFPRGPDFATKRRRPAVPRGYHPTRGPAGRSALWRSRPLEMPAWRWVQCHWGRPGDCCPGVGCPLGSQKLSQYRLKIPEPKPPPRPPSSPKDPRDAASRAG